MGWHLAPGARLCLALVALLIGHLVQASAAGASPPADIIMWGHPDCPHCRSAHAYLDGLRQRRPELVVLIHDVTEDQNSFEELRARSQGAGLDMVGLPSFLVRGTFLVGFDSATTTGSTILGLLPPHPSHVPVEHAPAHPPGSPQVRVPEADGTSQHSPSKDSGDGISKPSDSTPGDGEIRLPWLGQVSARQLGLPVFTIAVGLVDGFNPCAMWVLMFLLAVLVNVRSRARMLAIAGTFVVVSGLAYFAFMAAWLNVFHLIGLSRAVQVTLGLLALVVALVNIKDFFAFQRGLSFSIPEGAKPGIYTRVRSIVRAETLGAALVGATVLAVLVNVIELICTAGLPALYTQVLLQHGVTPGARYGYLGLYIFAYMLDDSIMVGIAVITLGRRKLQERGGRWLKLLSGIVILVLGALLIFAPQALLW